jgi:hypothetical protein
MLLESLVAPAPGKPASASIDEITSRSHRTDPDNPAHPKTGRCPASAERSSRKLALHRQLGFFTEDTKGCAIERACTLEDLRAAYSLVHDVFVDAGYIRFQRGGIRLRIYEACPETATFVAKKDGVVVGVLSVAVDSEDLGLPSDGAFKTELDALRRDGGRLCELTNQVVAKEYRRSALPAALMRCATAHMLTIGCDRAVAAVSPRHSAFYRLAGFTQFGDERSYSTEIHDPVVGLSVEIGAAGAPAWTGGADAYVFQFMVEANQFRSCAAEWQRRARSCFLSADLLEGLLVHVRNFLHECSPAELFHLRRRWGWELFSAVWEAAVESAPRDAARPQRGEANQGWTGWGRRLEEISEAGLAWLRPASRLAPEPG